MDDRTGLRPTYVAAVDYASAVTRKDRHELTRDDLRDVAATAIRISETGHLRALHILIAFPELRKLYCQGPEAAKSPKRGGRPVGARQG